jgi:hypothetical protein
MEKQRDLPPSTIEDDTTIIITSSLIPSHPSLDMIDETIKSLSYLQGLSERARIIITVDGVYKQDRGPDSPKNRILAQYIEALRNKYDKYHITILCEKTKVMLVGNVRKAMESVNTEFVYLIQHDMPFIAPVDHTALIRTFQGYPESVRLVRFSPRRTLKRNKDRLGICGEVEFQANGIELSKTHTWSDK